MMPISNTGRKKQPYLVNSPNSIGKSEARSSMLLYQNPFALKKMAPLGQMAVVGNKVPVRNTVTIQQYQVITGRASDGLVADGRRPKALVGMPDMPHGKGCRNGQLVNQGLRFRRRTIIRNEHFIRQLGLLTQAG